MSAHKSRTTSGVVRTGSGLATVERSALFPTLCCEEASTSGGILDSKFKRTSSQSFKHHDFYQVLAYCTALGTPRGGLVYPRSELHLEEVDETFINASPIAIRRFALNLAVDASALPAEVARLAREVYSWVGPAERPSARLALATCGGQKLRSPL